MGGAGSPHAIAAGRLDEPALERFAAGLAARLSVPMTVYLEGDLGAGKTTLCRALIQALGHRGRVKSPTYGLLERYVLPGAEVLHLDLYRIGHAAELEYLGLADMLGENTLLLVEWPERGTEFLPQPDLVVRLDHDRDSRFVYLSAHTARGRKLCNGLSHHLS